MKLVIEVPEDLENDEAQKAFFRRMQEESDLHAAESPEDHWPGFGTMDIGTPHMKSDAKIVGFLHSAEVAEYPEHYEIEPLTSE